MNSLYAKLYDTYQRCRKPNWGGGEELPIAEDTYKIAVSFCTALPLSADNPFNSVEVEVDADADGMFELDWHNLQNKNTISLCIDEFGMVYVAWIIAGVRGCDKFLYDGGPIKDKLVKAIEEVCKV